MTLAILAIGLIGSVSAVDVTINSNTPGGLKAAIDKVGNGETIYLENGIYSGEDNTGFRISKSITISGKGNVVIDPQGKNHAFSIGNVKVTLKNLKIENAIDGNDNNSVFNTAAGAICNNHGSLTVINCTFNKNNLAIYSWKALTVKNSKFTNNNGGAIECVGDISVSGSIFNNNGVLNNYKPVIRSSGSQNIMGITSISKCTISKCTFTNNKCSAIENSYVNCAVSKCTFTNNKDCAITSSNSFLSVSGSTFKNNTGTGHGGAIMTYNPHRGSLSVNGCTFINNKAKYHAGAIYGSSKEKINKITVKNSKFTNNEATTHGGAIFIDSKCILRLNSVTFKNNVEQGNNYNAIYSDKGKVYKNKVTITPKDGTKNKKKSH